MKKLFVLALALVVVAPAISEAGCHGRCRRQPVRKVLRAVGHVLHRHCC